jgi:tRNA(fMet)-specific endonuclease VapC
MYLLDTNICIYAINGRHPHLTEKLLSIHPDEIFISSITVGEMEYGAAKSHWGDRTRQIMHAFLANYDTLPFTDQDAALFGAFRAQLESAGITVGVLDVMIAAQGVSNNLTVVTHNTREFIRIPGIKLNDWVIP